MFEDCQDIGKRCFQLTCKSRSMDRLSVLQLWISYKVTEIQNENFVSKVVKASGIQISSKHRISLSEFVLLSNHSDGLFNICITRCIMSYLIIVKEISLTCLPSDGVCDRVYFLFLTVNIMILRQI